MNRLLFCMAFTSDVEQMKAFYRDGIGLPIASESPFFVQFGTNGASLALLAIQPSQDREFELCFESTDIVSQVAELRVRGVEFIDEIRRQEFGKVIHARDPGGNLISLLETAKHGSPQVSSNTAPTFSTVILNCDDVSAMRAFYRDRLGFHPTQDTPGWFEFDAGSLRLALQSRANQPSREHQAQGLTVGFEVDDLMSWVDGARSRGVHFFTAPIDEDQGLISEAIDPDGNVIIFREPAAAPALEEQLAEAFEDDGTPRRAAIRKPVKKGARAVSRVAVRPEYKAEELEKKPRPKPMKKRSVRVSSTRGAGPEGTRLKPKRVADPKRARNRPAVGRLKKAERRTLSTKKESEAIASKTKPVKHAAAARGPRR